MFKINPSPTFTADVKVSVPGQDAPALLTLTFRHKGRKALNAWVDGAQQGDDVQLLDQVIESWRGVVDEQGAPVPYGAAALASLLDDYPASGGEIFSAYVKELTGARGKN
jgi:hypothetical protein